MCFPRHLFLSRKQRAWQPAPWRGMVNPPTIAPAECGTLQTPQDQHLLGFRLPFGGRRDDKCPELNPELSPLPGQQKGVSFSHPMCDGEQGKENPLVDHSLCEGLGVRWVCTFVFVRGAGGVRGLDPNKSTSTKRRTLNYVQGCCASALMASDSSCRSSSGAF